MQIHLVSDLRPKALVTPLVGSVGAICHWRCAQSSPDVRLTGHVFDHVLSGYFDPKLSLYAAMENLPTGHELMLSGFNKYTKEFVPTSLYLRWQVTFQTPFSTVKVMQVRDPTANLYTCQIGSQPAENLLSISRTLNHTCNFDVTACKPFWTSKTFFRHI